MSKKSLEFIVPSFFPKEQLFGMKTTSIKGAKEIQEEVIFKKKGQIIVQNYEDPKLKAKQLCNTINGLKTKDCVVRLTFKDSNLNAYVVIDKNNAKQVEWGKTHRVARIINEKKRGILPSQKTQSKLLKLKIAI